MKALLLVDIPDEVWKNKEKDLGMYVELWSERIDKDWFGKYYSDSLKPMPQAKQIFFGSEREIYKNSGWNECINEILGGKE